MVPDPDDVNPIDPPSDAPPQGDPLPEDDAPPPPAPPATPEDPFEAQRLAGMPFAASMAAGERPTPTPPPKEIAARNAAVRRFALEFMRDIPAEARAGAYSFPEDDARFAPL